MTRSIIKQCPMCARQFSVVDLLEDLSVEVIGMMSLNEASGVRRVYFFNHNCPGCGTSFAVSIEHFAGLIREQVPKELLAGTAACKGHCTRLDSLTLCEAACSSAPYRRFLVNVLLDGEARLEVARIEAANPVDPGEPDARGKPRP